jgi:transposase
LRLSLPNNLVKMQSMKAYSNDLRRSIVAAYEKNNHSQHQVAELFGVSPATVRNLVRRKRETASTDALPPAGGNRPRLDQQARDRVRQLVAERNDQTLAELRQQLEREQHPSVSLSTLCRLLQWLGLPRKKKRSMTVSVTPRESSKRGRAISKR